MAKATGHVVEHDGGWAYRMGDVISETFASHELARRAAERAAAGRRETRDISYEGRQSRWHVETAKGGDRPDTEGEEG